VAAAAAGAAATATATSSVPSFKDSLPGGERLRTHPPTPGQGAERRAGGGEAMAIAMGVGLVSDPVPPTFEVGDPVFSPAHGLGQVVAIERRDVDGDARDVYVILITVQGTDIRLVVPVQGTRTVGLRRPIDRKTATSVLDVFKEPHSAVEGIPWVRQLRHYQQLLHSGSAEEVARVFRDLLRLRLRKELSFGQRQLLDSARRMLVKEVALAFGDTEARVERRFERAVGPST